ncbi:MULTISPECIES: hypothetical protein [Mucilaginibacter]|uniref:Uncharacterized protein n=1 Tax=Mucilaginibacter rubeus TaxID=2027860 RepID=A0ABX7U549_9SPHI|nr:MULTISPECIES: hypothetical protein [Mucilaginibacter]QTE40976.1 hypothetical protein J3L19_18635 [Mucilaginibacter rubeus]QTE47579.1 hypothetical protein J3L21_18610 [Mucilaginibacter rubeus]QTE58970.1 hypothetical protein J3L23_10270 [Mucilaginibacter rubeus]QTE61569.1 hypothetical protein J3L22_23575 [Mucilaginibacter rubeus]QTF60327.1 hypothetical protein J3L20_23220 [Mucilaginibacter rubeus]
MKVKLIKVETAEEVKALIKEGKAKELPSMQDGWRFNFEKLIKKLKNATGYLLVTEETPDIIEGALIFQLVDKVMPYMAYLEVAPHNRSNPKKYEQVAGCLIAYAFQQSVIQGKGDYNSMLQFDVLEEKKEDAIKLMAVYSGKYNAKRWDDTTMVIMDEDGESLVTKYLILDTTEKDTTDDGKEKEKPDTNDNTAEQ